MGFGLYDKEVINILRKFNEPEPYLRGIIADINFKVKKVKYTHKKRLVGKTKNNIISLVNLGLVAFTSYSKFPLRIISIFAFLFAPEGTSKHLFVMWVQVWVICCSRRVPPCNFNDLGTHFGDLLSPEGASKEF